MTAAEAAAFFAAQPPNTPVVIATVSGTLIEARALLVLLVPSTSNTRVSRGSEWERPKPFDEQTPRECVLVGAG